MQLRWAVVIVAVLGLGLGLADAKPKVVVAPIDGDDTGDLVDQIADAVDGEDLDVVSMAKVDKAFSKLGYEGEDLSEKQARKVAKELDADVVLVAKAGKRGKNKTLKFAVYIDGKKERGFRVIYNNDKSPKFKEALREKVVEKVKRAKRKGGDDDEDKDRDDDDSDDDEDDDGRKKKRIGARDGDDDEDPEIEAAVRRVSPHSANTVAVRVDMGASVANRSLSFTQRPGNPLGPKPYSNPYVPGARIEGELYPFAFGNPKSLAAGLGFAGEYDRTIRLNLTTSTEPGVPVPTKQWHWSIGLRYRIPFGKTPTSPTLTLGGGYGKRVFSPDRSPLQMASSLDLPSTNYTVFDPGLTLRVPFVKQFALTLGGRAMLITDTGMIQRLDQYGRARVFGITTQGGFDIVLGNRFAIRIVGEFTQIGYSFIGNGEKTNNTDGDPTTKDIGGAVDRSIGGAMTLAVLY